jgi:hypothetical protein
VLFVFVTRHPKVPACDRPPWHASTRTGPIPKR